MNHIATSADKQRAILLKALQQGPVSTIFARESLGIPHPAGRAYELRASGVAIQTLKAWETDISGKSHLVAQYALGGVRHG